MKRIAGLFFLIFGCHFVIAKEVNSTILSISILKSLGYKESKLQNYNGPECDGYELDFPAVKNTKA